LAQYSSNIQGVVSDPAGAAINGASVRLRNVDTGVTAMITTVESGNYRFSSLPAGNYVATAEATGFRKGESSFTLSTSETKGINLALPLAGAQQTFGGASRRAAVNLGSLVFCRLGRYSLREDERGSSAVDFRILRAPSTAHRF
jgi:hypothetical protein